MAILTFVIVWNISYAMAVKKRFLKSKMIIMLMCAVVTSLSPGYSGKHMMTSSNGVTGHLCVEFTGEFPAQRPVTRSFDVFLDLRLNERLPNIFKHSRGWWFETPSRSLSCHCNAIPRIHLVGLTLSRHRNDRNQRRNSTPSVTMRCLKAWKTDMYSEFLSDIMMPV